VGLDSYINASLVGKYPSSSSASTPIRWKFLPSAQILSGPLHVRTNLATPKAPDMQAQIDPRQGSIHFHRQKLP